MRRSSLALALMALGLTSTAHAQQQRMTPQNSAAPNPALSAPPPPPSAPIGPPAGARNPSQTGGAATPGATGHR